MDATNMTETQDSEDTGAKAAIARAIDAFVTEKTGKRIGIGGGKHIFDMIVGMMFTAAVKDEEFRFPAGHGAFHVRHLGVGTRPKRLPSGAVTTAQMQPGRVKLRYVEGVKIKQLLGTAKQRDRKTSHEGTSPASTTELETGTSSAQA